LLMASVPWPEGISVSAAARPHGRRSAVIGITWPIGALSDIASPGVVGPLAKVALNTVTSVRFPAVAWPRRRNRRWPKVLLAMQICNDMKRGPVFSLRMVPLAMQNCTAAKSPNPSDMIVVAVSLDPFQAQEVTFELPLCQLGVPDHGAVAVEDLMRDHRFVWTGKLQRIRLDPAEIPFAIWRLAPLQNRKP
jgi:hypothetical protein